MAAITAGLVKDLRERTGAGMMDCKKALEETDGNFEQAIEWLQKKQLASVGKKAGRIAADGVVSSYLHQGGRIGVLVEVNCETDFVARNEDFVAFARKLAELVAQKNPADVAALSALPMDGGTVESVRQALVQKIGENMSIRRFRRFATAARLASYVHGGGRIGVIVEFDGGDDALGKDVAMHVAASGAPGAVRPVAVSRSEVPADLIAKEREIYTAQAAESGKPAEIVARMVEGRVNKFLAEVTLLGQPFVKNPDETVEKVLKAKGASVKAFAMYVVGEGIERRKDDFAAEVAAMAKA